MCCLKKSTISITVGQGPMVKAHKQSLSADIQGFAKGSPALGVASFCAPVRPVVWWATGHIEPWCKTYGFQSHHWGSVVFMRVVLYNCRLVMKPTNYWVQIVKDILCRVVRGHLFKITMVVNIQMN